MLSSTTQKQIMECVRNHQQNGSSPAWIEQGETHQGKWLELLTYVYVSDIHPLIYKIPHAHGPISM